MLGLLIQRKETHCHENKTAGIPKIISYQQQNIPKLNKFSNAKKKEIRLHQKIQGNLVVPDQFGRQRKKYFW